jgi:hypothetical protein
MKRIAVLLLSVLAFGTAWAGHQKVVQGMVVNLGIVPATKLEPFSAEKGHGANLPGGSQHLLVSVSDAKSGVHVADAKVTVEVTDPKGAVQKKELVLGRTAGIPDYSEIFIFGWSGKYRVRVTIEPRQGKPIRADFVWTHTV